MKIFGIVAVITALTFAAFTASTAFAGPGSEFEAEQDASQKASNYTNLEQTNVSIIGATNIAASGDVKCEEFEDFEENGARVVGCSSGDADAEQDIEVDQENSLEDFFIVNLNLQDLEQDLEVEWFGFN
jgi:hypothetical protein